MIIAVQFLSHAVLILSLFFAFLVCTAVFTARALRLRENSLCSLATKALPDPAQSSHADSPRNNLSGSPSKKVSFGNSVTIPSCSPITQSPSPTTNKPPSILKPTAQRKSCPNTTQEIANPLFSSPSTPGNDLCFNRRGRSSFLPVRPGIQTL